MDKRPIILKDGKLSELSNSDELLLSLDFHSGISEIDLGESYVIREKKQSIVFIQLTLDGDLTLNGDLWLA